MAVVFVELWSSIEIRRSRFGSRRRELDLGIVVFGIRLEHLAVTLYRALERGATNSRIRLSGRLLSVTRRKNQIQRGQARMTRPDLLVRANRLVDAALVAQRVGRRNLCLDRRGKRARSKARFPRERKRQRR